MKPLRILHLHRDLPPDSYTGVAVQVHRLANALTGIGHDVTVATLSPRPPDADYSVLALPQIPAGFTRCKRVLLPIAFRGLDSEGFDAVHVHGDGAFLRIDSRFVRTFYGTASQEARHARGIKGRMAQSLSYWMESREARAYPVCTAISGHVRLHLSRISHVIPCMLASEPPNRIPRKHTDPTLIYLGSRFTRKRGESALRIYSRLRKVIPRLRMHYIGPEPDVMALRKETDGMSPWENLYCHTRLSRNSLEELYAESWIYLSTAGYEGFGVSLIEAMAAGCIPVSVPHPGALEIITPGETGYLGSEEDIPGLVKRLIAEPTLVKNVAEKALIRSRDFAPGKIAREYESLYHASVSRRNRGED